MLTRRSNLAPAVSLMAHATIGVWLCMTDETPSDAQRLTFTAFVLSLAHTAAVHFGDVPGPEGEGQEVNLPAAQQMIDILSLLEEKTRGNLTVEERQIIDQLLYELRLRYVQAGQPPSRIIVP